MNTKTNPRGILAILMGLGILSGTTVLSGCEEGAFEDAGESIDDAADDIDDEI